MKKIILSCLSLLFLTAPAMADMVMVEDPWSRETPGKARTGVVFMKIINMGTDNKVIEARADVSKIVELHTHIHEDGIMKMREVKALDLPGSSETMLEPGGLHIMLIGLNAPLKARTSFPVTLVFEKGEPLTFNVPVKKLSYKGHKAHESHDMKGKMHHDHAHEHEHEHDHHGHDHKH